MVYFKIAFTIWAIFGLFMVCVYITPASGAQVFFNNDVMIEQPAVAPAMKELILPRMHGVDSDSDDDYIITEVTSYSEIDSCHYAGCVMSSGVPAYVGAVACPREIDLGVWVEIEGLGKFKCEDRTALYFNGRYDVFQGYGADAYYKALEFGVRKLKIKLL